MEMRCEIKIYEYQPREGKFSLFTTQLIYTDVNTSAKEMFKMIMKSKDDMNNKFFTMIIDTTIKEPFEDSIDFYTVKTNVNGDVDDITIIGPNNLDQEMLVDAILGCKPTKEFVDKCNDRIIDKITYPYDGISLEWTDDAKDRLKKVNVLRLKEIYQKLRANQ